MKALIFVVLASVLASKSTNAFDSHLGSEIAKAIDRVKSDYLLKLWRDANDAILESQKIFLETYTKHTMVQANDAIEKISSHFKQTVSECELKRKTVESTIAIEKAAPILNCMYNNEIDTLKAYKLTGYNLHDCIRRAQINAEAKYREIVKNLKDIKDASIRAYGHYVRILDNCMETSCVLATLYTSNDEYEKLTDQILSNRAEIRKISIYYIHTQIAMGCNHGSTRQISENYQIGRDSVDSCLILENNPPLINSGEYGEEMMDIP